MDLDVFMFSERLVQFKKLMAKLTLASSFPGFEVVLFLGLVCKVCCPIVRKFVKFYVYTVTIYQFWGAFASLMD